MKVTTPDPIIDIEANEEKTGKRWKKIAVWSVVVFGILLIACFIFSYFSLQQITDHSYSWFRSSGKEFSIIVLAGFLAQLVDGALGMGYGVTSATILLSAGVSPCGNERKHPYC
jgi:hypothetical protein